MWKTCTRSPNYVVSDQGEVKRVTAERGTVVGKILKGAPCRGYLYVSLDGQRLPVHKLVLETFRGPRAQGQVARHLDGVRVNNKLTNLVWDTREANEADKVLHGTSNRGENHGLAKLTTNDVHYIRTTKYRASELADLFGVSRGTINDVRSGRRRQWG